MHLGKKYLGVLMLVALALVAWVTGTGRIKVVITDENGQAIPYANVIVYRDQYRITGGQTNNEGRCLIMNIPQGRYELKFSRIQYKSIDSLYVNIAADSISQVNVMMHLEPDVKFQTVQPINE